MIHRLRQFRWLVVTLIGCLYAFIAPLMFRRNR